MQDKVPSSTIRARTEGLPATSSLTPPPDALPRGQRFELGSIIVTPEALRALQRFGIEASTLLFRHAACDWGDLDPLDQRINARALQSEDRLVSCYVLRTLIGGNPRREALWIVTEGERRFTTLLLQDESWREVS